MPEQKEDSQKRLFIAIEIPQKLRQYFYNTIIGISNKNHEIRAIVPDNIHLTLKFLDYTNVSRIPKIVRAINSVSASFPEFSFSTGDRIKAFPDLKSARIIFVPVEEGNEKIIQFYDKLEDSLNKIKIRKEPRKFIPHLTVARIRNMIDLSEEMENIGIAPQKNVKCAHITLFESVLKKSGSIVSYSISA
ncbi:MAG: RNA 2',3'-cyclic phosphodiesterase, partial [Actinobacteria bacterium]|nr:RNA 2',3'-cyclic phosphodiesterase [Actinomycetota bacterium]